MIPLLLFAACASEEPSPGPLPSETVSTPAPVPVVGEPDLDALRALGYLDYVDEEQGAQEGLMVFDRSRAQPGVTLVASRPHRRADLVSLEGEVLHSWTSQDPAGRWVRVRLLEGGDLLAVGKGLQGEGEARYLQRLNANSDEVWRRSLAIHHEVAIGPDEGWLTLELDYRMVPEIHAEFPIRDDRILFLDEQGLRVRSLSLYDSLVGEVEFNEVDPYEGDSGMMVDLFHSNSLFWMDPVVDGLGAPETRDPLYAPMGVLICIRHQNRVAILDSVTGDLRWTWGAGQISGPHDATLLDSGNVLLFDNGLGSNKSRVVEVDPRTDRVVWEYRAPNPTDFYSASRGSAQRFDNGNTLIAQSDSGRVFEVTADGEVVWEYWSPHISPKGERATVIRAIRYPDTWAP